MAIHENVFLNACIHKIEQLTCLSLFVHVSGCAFLCEHKGMRRRRQSKSYVFLHCDNTARGGAKQGVINVNGVMKPKSIRDVDIQEMSLFP